MVYQLFTEKWAHAWGAALNQNEAYRREAGEWEWPVIFAVEEQNGGRQVFLDLWHGQCREARMASETDVAATPFLISAPYDIWHQVLGGRLDPMIALLRGKLSLKKGKMVTLARYSKAAKQLVRSAQSVSTALQQTPEQADGITARRSSGWSTSRSELVTTSAKGLRHDIFPMRLYHKAKRLGIWNPKDIDLAEDRNDWQKLTELEKEVLLHLTTLFQAGEEAVTRDILPLIMVIANEGHLEEEMYLTTFLWEEAKHTEFFRRFLDEVTETKSDLSRFHLPAYQEIFYRQLPETMAALMSDSSPTAQIRASITYNMIVEGTLAETGYHAYHAMLERNRIMPGLQQGVAYLKRDESRHIAYGVFLLSRLMARDPQLWSVVEERMEEMLELGLAAINEVFASYETLPFGLRLEDFLDFAMNQFKLRLLRIERARGRTLEEIYQTAEVEA